MDDVLLAVESSDALIARLVAFCDQRTHAYVHFVLEPLRTCTLFLSPLVRLLDDDLSPLVLHPWCAYYLPVPDDVELKYQEFYRRHAEQFFGVDTDDDEEKSHAMHQLFQEYEQLFEAIIQDFLDAEELSGEAFFKHCRRLMQSPRHEDASTNLRIVLSALDFNAFCALMAQEAIQTQQALKAAEDMGL